MSIKAFFLEPTGEQRVYLRTYQDCMRSGQPCPGRSYHDARVLVGTRPEQKLGDGCIAALSKEDYPPEHWPVTCGCGYRFSDQAVRQVFTESLYRRSDSGEVCTLREAPEGAIWDAWWCCTPDRMGADGRCLVAKVPGGHEWMIDGRASNCDSPCRHCVRPYHQHSPKPDDCPGYEDARPHKCWVREGTPPLLTVGKNGITCGAGAGSILTPNWHGFLRNGIFCTA
jgi:hypothetical protein